MLLLPFLYEWLFPSLNGTLKVFDIVVNFGIIGGVKPLDVDLSKSVFAGAHYESLRVPLTVLILVAFNIGVGAAFFLRCLV